MTDSDDNQTSGGWRAFARAMALSALATLMAIGAFIVIMDPHDHLVFSPDFVRAPVNTNQRFSYPALARNPKFDSLVIGTSTIRLLRPDLLDDALGGTFVTLAMNSATAWEQQQIHSLFVRHHQGPGTLIVGIDKVWCHATGTPERLTPRPFPQWMYDDNPWNDVPHILNSATVEQAARQLEYQLGRRQPRYGFDGYENFLPDDHEYDLRKARQHIYGADGSPRQRSAGSVPVSDEQRLSWPYETLQDLRAVLARMPKGSANVLVFVPYHLFTQDLPGTLAGQKMAECKRRVVNMAREFANTTVIDFMIDSAITREDENYWDGLHYTRKVAEQIVRDIAIGVREKRAVADRFELLYVE